MVYTTYYLSPIGKLLLTSDGEALTGLWNEGQKYFGGGIKEEMAERKDLKVFGMATSWLDGYFAGDNPPISSLLLTPNGGEFRRIIWDILCKISYGKTTTYGDIAKEIALNMKKDSMSAQAVGGAVGHNPISIIIPCHRVVGGDGSLTGYAGGISKKIKLLELEGVDTSKLKVPKKGTAL